MTIDTMGAAEWNRPLGADNRQPIACTRASSEGVCLILFIGEECSQGSPLRGQPCALAPHAELIPWQIH